MFDLTTYVKKWRIRQLKTVFSTLDTLCILSQFFDSLIILIKKRESPKRREQLLLVLGFNQSEICGALCAVNQIT